MGKNLVALLYAVFVVILGVLAFILKKKHSSFPDFRVGYHSSDIMHSREQWERANILAGNLCALFAVLGLLIFAVLYFAQAGMETSLAVVLCLFHFFCHCGFDCSRTDCQKAMISFVHRIKPGGQGYSTLAPGLLLLFDISDFCFAGPAFSSRFDVHIRSDGPPRSRRVPAQKPGYFPGSAPGYGC